MWNTPVEVQFTSAGCLNYPCRTPLVPVCHVDSLSLSQSRSCSALDLDGLAGEEAADIANHPRHVLSAERLLKWVAVANR